MFIHHICIQTENYINSLNFYTKILKFKLVKESKGFNNRQYNSWLDLNGFMIELQTSKINHELVPCNHNSEGIVHFCLFSDNFDEDFERINKIYMSSFKIKDGKKIYSVGKKRLFKIISPEGTIIEIRDNKSI